MSQLKLTPITRDMCYSSTSKIANSELIPITIFKFFTHNKLLTRGGEQPVDLSEHAELIFDSEAVKRDGASRRVQHFVMW